MKQNDEHLHKENSVKLFVADFSQFQKYGSGRCHEVLPVLQRATDHEP